MGLTPSPTEAWPLAWIALVPLWFIVVRGQSIRGNALSGLIWGIGYHGLALFWITGIHPMDWMGVPWLASIAIALFCWIFITLWGALLVAVWAIGISITQSIFPSIKWVSTKATQQHDINPDINPDINLPSPTQNYFLLTSCLRVLIGTGLWCAIETLWSMSPLYWSGLSYTQSPHNLIILHLGQLSGPVTVTAAIVAVNGLIAESALTLNKFNVTSFNFARFNVETDHNNLPYGNANGEQKSTLLGIAIGLLISLHLLGWLLYSQPIEQSNDSAIKVGIIQGNIPNEIKLYSAGWRRAIKGYTTGYQTLADQKVDAVLTPETALPFLWEEQVRTVSSFYSAILDKGVLVWVGGYGQRERSLTNSLFTVTGTGETFSRYDKVKLVPLGEYIPFEEFLGHLIDRLSPLDAHLAPGKPDQLLETPFGQAVVGICYESAFADHFRYQAAAGGQFILTASNNAHYSNTMPAQHYAQDVMRSIETDRWTVRATNTGYSGIVDPHGKTVWLSGINTYELHADTIYRRQTRTLYVRWGNWLTPVLLGLGGIGWLVLGWFGVGVGLE
ncbi:apolipoprotein N-acyltransferase [Moorena sp. SIO3H5]|uniref:apolipoprotein N-acyltransferase n=1 Tax=Moorena sp. SIO3H5 TaxID=2607834 RepID=UPI0013BAF7FC|nr:apolipoprotein N-acyltransferase [Moorena sp. SIO3H5]NEO69561.1 apolipoprotein N-acyltransferase [Moorena sp. SIO3H5]